MRQNINCYNFTDANGNPAGGSVTGTGIGISWQNGPLGRGTERIGPNGAFVEGILEAALNRMHFYQTASNGKFACCENDEVISCLEKALEVLDRRTKEREARAVEGTHQA